MRASAHGKKKDLSLTRGLKLRGGGKKGEDEEKGEEGRRRRRDTLQEKIKNVSNQSRD